jgi:hypothetical protein
MKNTALCIGAALLASCAASAPSRDFVAQHNFVIDVPEGGNTVHAWFALPSDKDEFQDVADLKWKVDAPSTVKYSADEVRDELGNRFLHLSATGASKSQIKVDTSFEVVRREQSVSVDPADTRPLTLDERHELEQYLRAGQNDAATPAIEADARKIVGAETNPVKQARLLYDWVLDHVQYWVKDPSKWKASPVGSSEYCY